MVKRIAVVGGGPGGLFFALLHKSAHPGDDVVVFERNRPDDTFGFGVVFSDPTLKRIDAAHPVLRQSITDVGRRWDEIEVRIKGRRIRIGGNGMSAVPRKDLLLRLQTEARRVGVELRFESEVASLTALEEFDVVVAADGANSRLRSEVEDHLEPTVETASAKFIWFGTSYMFSGLTFVHHKGPHGTFAVHGYPISNGVSTFIVETDENSWRAAGLDEFDSTQAPGPSDEKSRRYLEALFADEIDGHPLLVNNSRWGNFRTRAAQRWSSGNVVFLGDAVHTAHFSVGSGTKMAMEDAMALADALEAHPDDLPAAFAAYEETAKPLTQRIQGAARPSLSWWERFATYHDALEPQQFAFHFMSRAISAGRIARGAPDFVEASLVEWRDREGAEPLATPLRAGSASLGGRLLELVDDGTLSLTSPSAQVRLPVRSISDLENHAPSGVSVEDPWALLVQAPENEGELDTLERTVRTAIARAHPDVVVIDGPSRLTRILLSENLRFDGVRTAVVDSYDEDTALTVVLSGRADAVVRRATADQLTAAKS